MARRKIIFVIVEGPSDEQALGVLLTRFFNQNEVVVQVMHQDITTQNGVTSTNIISKIQKVVKDYTEENFYNKKDFLRIIHLVDMDGAYIPNDFVVDDPAADDPIYSETQIRTKNKAGIEQRNWQKGAVLYKISNTKEIWTIPYQVFYMSVNLDHVLYNKLNSSDEEKEEDSFKFVRQYRDCIPEFIRFLSESDFSVTTGYKESWEYIRQDLHSLERHTNFGLCFLPDEPR